MNGSKAIKRKRTTKDDEDSKGKQGKPQGRKSLRTHEPEELVEEREWDCSQLSVPAQVLQVIGSHLSPKDLPAARLACRSWSGHISEATKHFTGLIHPVAETTAAKIQQASKIFPVADSCSFTLSGRVTFNTWCRFLGSINSNKKIEHLELVYLVPAEPKISSYSPDSRRGQFPMAIATVRNLSSLSFKNAFFPTAEAINTFASMARLTRLTFDSIDHGKTGAASSFSPSPSFIPQSKDLAALSSLTKLHELSLRTTGSAASTSDLTCLSALTRLRKLEVAGGLTMGKLVLQSITNLTLLQELSVSLDAPTTPSLAALHNLSGLRVLRVSMPTVNDKTTLDGVAYLVNNFQAELQALTLRAVQASPVLAAELYPLLASTGIRELTLNLSTGTHNIQGVTQLCNLRSLAISKLRSAACDMRTVLSSMPQPWLCGLEKLSLESFTNTELPASTLKQLSQLRGLRDLSVIGAENTKTLLELDLGALPTRLERLDLRFVYLACPVFHNRLDRLTTLSMRSCHMRCLDHFQTAVEGLVSLRSLDMDDIQQNMTDQHLLHLACLTRLTSLGVAAISNEKITNMPVQCLTTLTELHRLRWCAGDLLDFALEPIHLQSFRKLCILCIPNPVYWRVTRWACLSDVKELPYCELETLGA